VTLLDAPAVVVVDVAAAAAVVAAVRAGRMAVVPTLSLLPLGTAAVDATAVVARRSSTSEGNKSPPSGKNGEDLVAPNLDLNVGAAVASVVWTVAKLMAAAVLAAAVLEALLALAALLAAAVLEAAVLVAGPCTIFV
jgi:hypothetical protein